jgi:aryl-alcohol dehydrogenase-like predicted oxidoreductase
MTPSRLVLGTAQLGFSYGIANKSGQPNQKMATKIVWEAWKNGIREFDTAQVYGTSEEVLGKSLRELRISKEAKIITKLDPDLNHLDASVIEKSIDQSLRRLGIQNLFCIMLHREGMLSLWDKGLGKIIHEFVLSGKVEKFGVSLYSPNKAIEALKTEGIDILQLPTNILDRRFENSGVFKYADERKKSIYVRSIFLQGLILMNSLEIPEKMHFAKPVVEKIESLAKEFRISRQELAIGYIKSKMPNAHIVFGTETPKQVKENVDAWKKSLPKKLIDHINILFENVEYRILNPALW